MSYLNSYCISFKGQFKADIPTVNNDVRHYDNKHFEKRFQLPQTVGVNNGRWNPEGSGVYEFLEVKVLFCTGEEGERIEDNLLIKASFATGIGMAAGKMVDLDPQMQMTSELWGLRLSLLDENGWVLFEGDVKPCGLRDMQLRHIDESGKPDFSSSDVPMGADYYSILENIEWGEVSNSPFLSALKDETDENRLRIKMNHFGFDLKDKSDRFLTGNVIGHIAPWKSEEPLLFSNERRLYSVKGNIFQFTNFKINQSSSLLSLDMGMSIPINSQLGHIHPDYTHFVIGINQSQGGLSYTQPISRKEIRILAEYRIEDAKNWLSQTGGRLSCKLSGDDISLLENKPLVLFKLEGEKLYPLAKEASHGYFLRADQYIKRLDPDERCTTDLFLFKWGKPIQGIRPVVVLDPETSNVGSNQRFDLLPPKAKIPTINTPREAIDFKVVSPTNMHGKCTVEIFGRPPGNPREYIDGQIYLASYYLDNIMPEEMKQYAFDKIAVHLRNADEIIEKPVWSDIKDIWIQFGNLYPVMNNYIANFSDPDAILERKEIFLFSLQRDIHDPMYMPVSRNLSKVKMANLINWLRQGEPSS